MTTLETGSGASTIVFAAAGTDHTAVTPDAAEEGRVRATCRELGVSSDRVAFEVGFSHDVLPRLSGSPLDLVLLDGAHGNAGHVGHVNVVPGGAVCGCTARGCLEAEISGTAIARRTGAPAAVVRRFTSGATMDSPHSRLGGHVSIGGLAECGSVRREPQQISRPSLDLVQIWTLSGRMLPIG